MSAVVSLLHTQGQSWEDALVGHGLRTTAYGSWLSLLHPNVIADSNLAMPTVTVADQAYVVLKVAAEKPFCLASARHSLGNRERGRQKGQWSLNMSFAEFEKPDMPEQWRHTRGSRQQREADHHQRTGQLIMGQCRYFRGPFHLHMPTQ